MKSFLFAICITVIVISNITAQIYLNKDNDCSCLKQYTHSLIRYPKIQIGNISIKDSTKYTTPPTLIGNIDSLSTLIVYPQVALRAEVRGINTFLLRIDQSGKVKDVKLIRGLGAGLDESAIEILNGLKFIPATIHTMSVESEIYIPVNFEFYRAYDQPEFIFDEIKYEQLANMPYHQTVLKLTKEGSAYYKTDNGFEREESFGNIDSRSYIKLNDFIISQCFNDYEEKYYGQISDVAKYIITVKLNDKVKTVSYAGDANYPISLWAIQNVVLNMKNNVKWDNTKKESTLKQLPKKDENEK
jgi:TonB family protein